MKLKHINIVPLVVILLIGAFSISFSHTIIEQLGTGCEQHEAHDFSKVIVNASLRSSNEDDNSYLKVIDCILLPSSLFEYSSPLISNSAIHYSVPLLYYDKLYLTKTGTLLI